MRSSTTRRVVWFLAALGVMVSACSAEAEPEKSRSFSDAYGSFVECIADKGVSDVSLLELQEVGSVESVSDSSDAAELERCLDSSGAIEHLGPNGFELPQEFIDQRNEEFSTNAACMAKRGWDEFDSLTYDERGYLRMTDEPTFDSAELDQYLADQSSCDTLVHDAPDG